MKQQQLAQAGWEKGENGTMVNPVTREVWNPNKQTTNITNAVDYTKSKE